MADHQTTPFGKGLDLSFLEKPHEFDPRRLEEKLLVTRDGPIVYTKYPFYDEAL